MRPTTFFKFQTIKQEKQCSAHFLILTNKETQVHNLEKAIFLINLSIRTNTKNINKPRYFMWYSTSLFGLTYLSLSTAISFVRLSVSNILSRKISDHQKFDMTNSGLRSWHINHAKHKQKLHKQKLKMIWFDIKLKISIVQTTNKEWCVVAYIIAESEKTYIKSDLNSKLNTSKQLIIGSSKF